MTIRKYTGLVDVLRLEFPLRFHGAERKMILVVDPLNVDTEVIFLKLLWSLLQLSFLRNLNNNETNHKEEKPKFKIRNEK